MTSAGELDDEIARHGKPSDRERLARIFGVTLTQPAAPLLAAGSLVVVVPIVAAAAVAGTAVVMVGMRLADDREIARGLREVDNWGFPVTGYRAWLLAKEPAFDLELARDVGIDVIRESIAAVDSTAIVEKRGERVVRVVTRPVELGEMRTEWTVISNPPPPRTAVGDGGDRRLLLELRDRILAPLHADSGIVAMRMGDRATLAALVATAKEGGDGAFRDQALVAPPALQQLVVARTAHARPPNEASKRDHRWQRVLVSMGQPAGDGSAAAWVMSAGVILGPVFGVVGLVAAGVGSILAGRVTARGRRARVQDAIAKLNVHGFPIEGFEDYVISGRPMFDVELERAVPRQIVEDMLGPNTFTLTWIDDTLLRIETNPRIVYEPEVFEPFWGGDARQFADLVSTFLIPLHARAGIVAVRMGGYVARRA